MKMRTKWPGRTKSITTGGGDYPPEAAPLPFREWKRSRPRQTAPAKVGNTHLCSPLNTGREELTKGARSGWRTAAGSWAGGEEEEGGIVPVGGRASSSPLVTKPFILKQPPSHTTPSGANRAPSLRLVAAALEMPLFADPPRTPAAGVLHRFYVFILDGGASRPPPSSAGRPSADSFPPAVPLGMGGAASPRYCGSRKSDDPDYRGWTLVGGQSQTGLHRLDYRERARRGAGLRVKGTGGSRVRVTDAGSHCASRARGGGDRRRKLPGPRYSRGAKGSHGPGRRRWAAAEREGRQAGDTQGETHGLERWRPGPGAEPAGDSPTCRTLSTQPPSSRAMPLRKGSRFSSAAAAAAASMAPPGAAAPPGPAAGSSAPVLNEEYIQISLSLRGKDQ